MSTSQFDCVIVGGGLAGGLIALALHRARPEFRLALVEAGRRLGGNHRWSWFDSDLTPDGRDLLADFRQNSWDKGYTVAFPKYRRTLNTPYRSMSSNDFHAGLIRDLPEDALLLGRQACQISSQGVELDSGEFLSARAVIDCREFQPSAHLKGGWQVFMGRHMRLNAPHGLEQPMIMDATVDQYAPSGSGGAYRFVYMLPMGAHEVFVEDTYYADDARLDRAVLSSRIDQYCKASGWRNATPIGHETGILPVLTGGDFAAYQTEMSIPGVAIAGMRGGFSHPLTSYTLSIAVENALAIAGEADLTGSQLAAFLEDRARRHWRRTRFYRRLARMLFLAAEPKRRVRVFQRFYRMRAALIERFYAAKSRRFDKLRVLSGIPPVPIFAAIRALFSHGKPLKDDNSTETKA